MKNRQQHIEHLEKDYPICLQPIIEKMENDFNNKLNRLKCYYEKKIKELNDKISKINNVDYSQDILNIKSDIDYLNTCCQYVFITDLYDADKYKEYNKKVLERIKAEKTKCKIIFLSKINENYCEEYECSIVKFDDKYIVSFYPFIWSANGLGFQQNTAYYVEINQSGIIRFGGKRYSPIFKYAQE